MTHWVQSFYELLGRLGYPHPIHPTQVHMVIGLLTGAMIFESNCAGCHPGGGNALDPKKPIVDSITLSDYDIFKSFLRNPPSPMPSYPPDDLSAEQVRELFEYFIQAFRLSTE